VLHDPSSLVDWRVHLAGPKETQALRAELEKRPPPAAALDLHQDNYLAFRHGALRGIDERGGEAHAHLARDSGR
jgi:hypothetical protein